MTRDDKMTASWILVTAEQHLFKSLLPSFVLCLIVCHFGCLVSFCPGLNKTPVLFCQGVLLTLDSFLKQTQLLLGVVHRDSEAQ